MAKPDKLVITGITGLDGTYECDVLGMNSIGDPECMTNREGHRVKELSGARAGEILSEFAKYDTDITIALAVVILERHGRRVDVEKLLDAPIGSGITFDLGKRDAEGDADDPPEVTLPLDEQSSGEPVRLISGGGGSA